MKIYLVMVKDRHTDPEAHPFVQYLDAAAFAHEYLTGCGGWQTMPTPEGWLFYAVYSGDGDCVWIVEKELK